MSSFGRGQARAGNCLAELLLHCRSARHSSNPMHRSTFLLTHEHLLSWLLCPLSSAFHRDLWAQSSLIPPSPSGFRSHVPLCQEVSAPRALRSMPCHRSRLPLSSELATVMSIHLHASPGSPSFQELSSSQDLQLLLSPPVLISPSRDKTPKKGSGEQSYPKRTSSPCMAFAAG